MNPPLLRPQGGYPDGTYRGNRALSRYEFAAGLNACLEKLRPLTVKTDTAYYSIKQDLATLNRLAEKFQTELAALRSRADTLEARTSELQANQFSTTAKLNGEIIFAVSDAIGDGDTQAVPFPALGVAIPVLGGFNAGVGLEYNFSSALKLTLGYLQLIYQVIVKP